MWTEEVLSMPKPTVEQLEKINRFTIEPLTEENCFVFNDLMIDDQPTAYSSKIHPNLLTKFVRDANRGVGLLMNHNNRSLPVGRSYGAEVREEYSDNGEIMKSVYGQFYIDLGRNTESGMSTDDIAKGINSGTIFDTSIGFNAHSWDCSVCNYDIRDWENCSHFPGEKYQVKDDNGVFREETCYVIAGQDGQGELLENSLVYAGACDRATIKNNFSRNDVREKENGTKLHLVENFKNIPTNATIYQYFTNDGSVLFTETGERTNGLEQLTKRSEENVELAKIKETVAKFGIEFETVEELSTKLGEFTAVTSELATAKEQVTELSTKVEELETVKTDMEESLSKKDETITELTVTNEQLTEKAELANTYRQDLTAKALETGVRAQGNAFQKPMFEKFLATLSIDEIKEVISGFENEVNEKFANARTTEPKNAEPTRFAKESEPKFKGDFEDENQFRAHVADEATKYAKENGVSLKEATKLMYKKFTTEEVE